MCSGKNRINITQMQKSTCWCPQESRSHSRAMVGVILPIPPVHQGRAKTWGGLVSNPSLSVVSLLCYSLLWRHKFHCMATDLPSHWWKLSKFFWTCPRYTNEESFWCVRENTVLWLLTDTASFHWSVYNLVVLVWFGFCLCCFVFW